MSYTLRIGYGYEDEERNLLQGKRDVETCRRMLKTPDGGYYDQISKFRGILSHPNVDFVEISDIRTIEKARFSILELREHGIRGIITLLKNSSDGMKEVEVIPAITTSGELPDVPSKDEVSAIMEKYENLNEFVEKARSKYVGIERNFLKLFEPTKSTYFWMLLAADVFPDFKVGDVTTIGKLWRGRIDIDAPNFESPIPALGREVDHRVYRYGRCEEHATICYWYKLTRDVPWLYEGGKKIKITDENIGGIYDVEIEITEISEVF